MKKLPDLRMDFARLVVASKRSLCGQHVTEIIYGSDEVSEQINKNRPALNGLLKNGANIYALWVKKSTKSPWKLMYIGQRKAESIYQRLVQHLFTKNKKTGSKLERIRAALLRGEKIGVTVIHIEPDELRTSVEERLIRILREDGLCEWNIHS